MPLEKWMEILPLVLSEVESVLETNSELERQTSTHQGKLGQTLVAITASNPTYRLGARGTYYQ